MSGSAAEELAEALKTVASECPKIAASAAKKAAQLLGVKKPDSK